MKPVKTYSILYFSSTRETKDSDLFIEFQIEKLSVLRGKEDGLIILQLSFFES